MLAIPPSGSAEKDLLAHLPGAEGDVRATGRLIINADDWGFDRDTTTRTLECIRRGTVSSVSAMVYMRDSERAAEIALECGIDGGLHLNFTEAFTGEKCSPRLRDHREKIQRYLRRNKLAQAVYHPGLTSSFEYVVSAQLEEFERLYREAPSRIDGHHHMHLCANVVFSTLLPPGTQVRRNFSFRTGEKNAVHRFYRQLIDRQVGIRHKLTDYFFSLLPIEPLARVEGIFSLARQAVVEVETHPVNPVEYGFLSSGEVLRHIGDLEIARGFNVARSGHSR